MFSVQIFLLIKHHVFVYCVICSRVIGFLPKLLLKQQNGFQKIHIFGLGIQVYLQIKRFDMTLSTVKHLGNVGYIFYFKCNKITLKENSFIINEISPLVCLMAVIILNYPFVMCLFKFPLKFWLHYFSAPISRSI